MRWNTADERAAEEGRTVKQETAAHNCAGGIGCGGKGRQRAEKGE